MGLEKSVEKKSLGNTTRGRMEISDVFRQAVDKWNGILESTIRPDQPEFVKMLDECQELFQQVGDLVNEQQLFSTNETYHDIHTEVLPFISIPYYLGLLAQKRMENRLYHLRVAKMFFGNFIQVCEMVGILSQHDKEEAENPPSPAEKRDQLLQRGRLEKETNQRLKELEEKRKKLNPADYEGSDLEELERELHLTKLQQDVNSTFTEIRMIENELPILTHIEELKSKGQSLKPQPPPENKREPRPPITLFRDHRGELKAQVFRPHWIQPTVTIEQAAAIDMQYAVKGGGPQSAKPKKQDEDSDPDDEEKVKKARAWDDWCDDNPTGSGNSLGNLG